MLARCVRIPHVHTVATINDINKHLLRIRSANRHSYMHNLKINWQAPIEWEIEPKVEFIGSTMNKTFAISARTAVQRQVGANIIPQRRADDNGRYLSMAVQIYAFWNYVRNVIAEVGRALCCL